MNKSDFHAALTSTRVDSMALSCTRVDSKWNMKSGCKLGGKAMPKGALNSAHAMAQGRLVISPRGTSQSVPVSFPSVDSCYGLVSARLEAYADQ